MCFLHVNGQTHVPLGPTAADQAVWLWGAEFSHGARIEGGESTHLAGSGGESISADGQR